MTMKKFFVGVKAFIREERGILLIKHTEGHWDVPGGRIDNDEDFAATLSREFSEELPGTQMIAVKRLLGAHRLHKDIRDDISLVLIYFLVEARLPKELEFGNEHSEHLWIQSESDIPESINPEMEKILKDLLR